jgi:hypothetical protein
LHKRRTLRGKDVWRWTNELVTSAQATETLHIQARTVEWGSLVQNAIVCVEQWNRQWWSRLKEIGSRLDSDAMKDMLKTCRPVSSWIDWRLAWLKYELGQISDQMTPSWDAQDPFLIKLELAHHGLKTGCTMEGCNAFDIAERALNQAEEWDELWEASEKPASKDTNAT